MKAENFGILSLFFIPSVVPWSSAIFAYLVVMVVIVYVLTVFIKFRTSVLLENRCSEFLSTIPQLSFIPFVSG